jgi:hypothetical protein
MARKFLVTGKTGIIGRNLISDESIQYVQYLQNINFLKHDSPNVLVKAALSMECQGIIHLAWESNSSLDYNMNLRNVQWRKNTENLADLAIANNLELTLVGTCLDDDPNSTNVYIREKSLLRISLLSRIESETILWIRPYFVVDVEARRPRLVNHYISSAVENPIIRSGLTQHDYILSIDVAGAIHLALQHNLRGLLDVGSGFLTSNLDLCKSIGRELDLAAPSDEKIYEPNSKTADISILENLGWKPINTEQFLKSNW